MTDLEAQLRPILAPLPYGGGEYLRPWMTTSRQPLDCKVWVVGANPAKTFPASQVGSFEDYIDALFNRNGKSMRRLYDTITEGRPSRTRHNLDRVTLALSQAGIEDVLETNLNCYPTRMSADLNAPSRREGRDRGEQIFSALLEAIEPKVFWLHGSGASKRFRRDHLPTLPRRANDQSLCLHEADGRLFLLTPSLAPPAFNAWKRQFEGVLADACRTIKSRVSPVRHDEKQRVRRLGDSH